MFKNQFNKINLLIIFCLAFFQFSFSFSLAQASLVRNTQNKTHSKKNNAKKNTSNPRAEAFLIFLLAVQISALNTNVIEPEPQPPTFFEGNLIDCDCLPKSKEVNPKS